MLVSDDRLWTFSTHYFQKELVHNFVLGLNLNVHSSGLSVAYILVNYLIALLHSAHFLTITVHSSFILCVCCGKKKISLLRKYSALRRKLGGRVEKLI